MNSRILQMQSFTLHAGLLASPDDLNVTGGDENNEFYIEWNPPSVLEGIVVNYTICINFDNSSNDNDNQCDQEETTNKTELLFKVTSEGKSFHVCVFANTKAGRGNESCGKFVINI